MSAALSHYQNSAPTGGIWHSLNRLLVGLILMALALLTAYRFAPEFSKRRVQQAILDELKVQVEKERQLLAQNLRDEEMLRRNKDYVGIIARDRLDLMKPGETIYRIDSSRPAAMRLNR